MGIFSTAVMNVCAGEGDVSINENHFPDVVFRNYIKNNLDSNKDGVLSTAEIKATKEISLDYSDVKSFAGIEYFGNLEKLDISHNQLVTLDLSKNTELLELYCNYNNLTTLDVSKNTKLLKLYCRFNNLTTLDVSKNTKLLDLDCTCNDLTTLDVSKNTALKYLECSNNQLTTLDVSKNKALKSLNCGDNQISILDLNNNTELTCIYCANNQLTTLDVSKHIGLESLYCYDNKLTTLRFGNNTVLSLVYCYGNQLTALDLSKNIELTKLGCESNKLRTLDLSKNTKLKYLSCYDNKLTTLDVSRIPQLKEAVLNGEVDKSYSDHNNYYKSIYFLIIDKDVDIITVSYAVTFNANGAGGSMEEIYVPKGDKFTLPECGFLPEEGKVFDKWDKGKPGDVIDVSNDLTLNALWKNHSLTFVPVPAKAATCTVNGNEAYYKCSECGKYYLDADGMIEIYENSWVTDIDTSRHAYSAPIYTWSDDGKTCTAKAVCEWNKDHVVTEDATISSAVTTEATMKSKGITTYTAIFTKAPFTVQTKDISDIPELIDNIIPESEVITGKLFKDKLTNASYIITSEEPNNLTIAYVSSSGENNGIETIPEDVTINGKKYKVTEIKANAFKNNKKLKKITIGKNIKKIGKNAFLGCKNLKTVTIMTKKLTKKTVGVNAFKGINDKAKVRVPKSKLKSYKKILKASGIKGKKQQITK